MDESLLLALIAGGENEQVDFKRVLDLSSAKGKAEFIKDIISIANSTSEGGYLLIGIEDNMSIIGSSLVEEERIQQLVQTYITPAIMVRCDNIPLASSGFLSVSTIHIKPTSRPHKVARGIESLLQNDVFIRHGSITARASPEEIIRMHDEDTQLNRTSRQFIKSAETHLKLKNYESAIAAYSKALDLTPSAQLFLDRAKAYIQYMEKGNSSQAEIRDDLIKDLTDAIALADSTEVEYEAHSLRYEHRGGNYYSSELFDQDFDWLKKQFQGVERGKFIFEEIYYNMGDFFINFPQEALPLLNEVIELGYEEPKVYAILAEVHYLMFNFGLALETINRGFNNFNLTDDQLADFLIDKGGLLSKMNRFQEACECYTHAKLLQTGYSKSPVIDRSYSIVYGITSDFLYSYVLGYEFGHSFSWAERIALKVLVYDLGRSISEIEFVNEKSKEIKQIVTRLARLEKNYPGITHLLREIIGDENWQTLKNDEPLGLNIKFQSITEQLPSWIR